MIKRKKVERKPLRLRRHNRDGNTLLPASAIARSLFAILGLNGAFVFGFTMSLDLGVKSLVDLTFISNLSLSFMVFAAGLVSFFKIAEISAVAAATNRMHQSLVDGVLVERERPIFLRHFLDNSYVGICVLIFGYFLITYQFLNLIPALLFLVFSTVPLFLVFAWLQYNPLSGVIFDRSELVEQFRSYISASLTLRGYAKGGTLLKFNVGFLLALSVGLGDARYRSLSDNQAYCVSVDGLKFKVGLIAQSSEYLFFAQEGSSLWGIFKRDPIVVVPKAEIKLLANASC